MRVSILLVGLMALTSCRSSDSPEALAEKMRSLGAYVETDSGIVPVPTYGTEEFEGMSQTLSFRFAEAIPEAKRVSHFYLNLPDANISESKLYLLDDMSEARWRPLKQEDPGAPRPASATVEPVTDRIYKFSSEEMSILEVGFVCLRTSMPMGTPDRMYCVHLAGA